MMKRLLIGCLAMACAGLGPQAVAEDSKPEWEVLKDRLAELRVSGYSDNKLMLTPDLRGATPSPEWFDRTAKIIVRSGVPMGLPMRTLLLEPERGVAKILPNQKGSLWVAKIDAESDTIQFLWLDDSMTKLKQFELEFQGLSSLYPKKKDFNGQGFDNPESSRKAIEKLLQSYSRQALPT